MRIVVDLNRLFRLHGEETLEHDYAPDEALHEWRCEDRPLQPAINGTDQYNGSLLSGKAETE